MKEEIITASANNQTVVAELSRGSANDRRQVEPSEAQVIAEKYKAMSKQERKTFRKTLKKELLSYSKKPAKTEGVESIKATKAFDTLAALAIVFGGAGIVMIMLAGVSNVFWVLGAISLVIGAFLFVRWVANGNG
jgi:Flp pilus assembly protein TadB